MFELAAEEVDIRVAERVGNLTQAHTAFSYHLASPAESGVDEKASRGEARDRDKTAGEL